MTGGGRGGGGGGVVVEQALSEIEAAAVGQFDIENGQIGIVFLESRPSGGDGLHSGADGKPVVHT